MSHQETVNSNIYWDRRFGTDWESNGGREQSRFFARVAIDALPQWLVHAVRWNNLTVCDWGCAQGDGTDVLAQMLSWDVTGVDFSGAAIERARRRYGSVKFLHENLLDAPDRPPFDVIFSSNTLEHFSAPWDAFNKIANYASKFIVLLLPYREFDRHAEHEVTFDAVNIPVSPSAEWVLVHRSVTDTSLKDPSYWPGEQILLVYARTAQLAAQHLTLADVGLYGGGGADGFVSLNQRLAAAEARHAREMEASQELLAAERSRADDVAARLTAFDARHAREMEAAHEACRLAREQVESTRHLLATERSRADAAEALLAAASERHACEIGAVREECHLERERAQSLQAALADERARADAAAVRFAAADASAASTEARNATLLADLETERRQSQRLAEQTSALAAAAHQSSERIHFLEYRERALINEVRTLLATKSWRMTAPLRVVRGTPDWMRRRIRDVHYAYVHGGIVNVVGRSLAYAPKHLKRLTVSAPTSPTPHNAIAPSSVNEVVAVQPPRLSPAPADVFVFGIIDWHFRIQRPQHLAREFARAGHRVYYFSNHFVDSKEPGFSVERLDDTLPLYQVKLKVSGAPAIYFAAPTAQAVTQILEGIRLFRDWSGTHRSWSLVQHGYWCPVATCMQSECVTYDCMDHHEGFGNVPQELLDLEERMMRRADLLVATSSWLEDHARKYNSHVEVIRNAGQYADFCNAPEERFIDTRGRKVIGYYGAIAEWFDADLVARVAQAFPDTLVLLVGADTVGVAKRLSTFPNIQMTGEVPYARLPYYLYAFDLCMLPFKVMPLTLATNPVKVYEYLGAGRSVVSIDLPEMAQFGDLVRVADSHEGFIERLREAMAALPDAAATVDRRKAFAAGQTWAHRVHGFRRAIEALPRPKVSAIVLTYNNLALTKDCLDSLEANSGDVDLEIVVVDNASSDGSPAYLSSWAASRPKAKLILNSDNRGFAAGNNQGLAAASGDYLVILNNDTVVTSGWAGRMVNHLRNEPGIGILGPLTNNIGNEARVDTRYADLEAMHREAKEITGRNLGGWFLLNTVAFFCAMMPRSTYERCGPLSEDYGVGFFEDDDYCRRVQQAGLAVACAEDAFVHHHLSASFNKLGEERKRTLFETNRAIYESKWGPWTPHRYRSHALGDAGPGAL